MATDEEKIQTFSVKLLANDTIKFVSLLTSKINKITRDAVEKKWTFTKYKLELLKDKKLEEAVMKENSKPAILSVEALEKEFNNYNTHLRDDKNLLETLETGLFFYIERLIRQLTVISKVRLDSIRSGERRDSRLSWETI